MWRALQARQSAIPLNRHEHSTHLHDDRKQGQTQSATGWHCLHCHHEDVHLPNVQCQIRVTGGDVLGFMS